MHPLLLVMSGGAIGAGARYASVQWATRLWGPEFPWGTLAVNIIGGLFMGLLAGWLIRSGGENARLFAGVGILGGFTTFSAFSLDSWMMIERGQMGLAVLYIIASVIGAIAALMIGLSLARTLA